MMIARILLGLGLILVAPAAWAQSLDRIAELPRLKSTVTVARDTVRIGDLIENAGPLSDIAIFRAPDPGSTGSVSAERVLEVVRAHNLLLVNSSGVSDVEVTRVSRAIRRSEIEARIVRAFAAQFTSGDPSRFAVTFEREPRTIHVEPQVTGELQVTRSSYDPRSTRFDVTFDVPGGAGHSLVRYTGTFVETAQAVMLARPINRGETVRASDLIVERRPKSEVPGDAISDAAEAAGMAARAALRAGPPLRRADLVKPEIVKRDETVTLIFEVPGIVLTVRGKALEGGAEGDVINVLNIQSKRTVQGIVSGPGRVTMAAALPITVTEAAEAAPAKQSE
jgi:flagella basal body P-ring formation protein FlgA